MDKKIIHFFKNVMYYLRYYDWKINILYNSSEGYCWKKRKIIDLGVKNLNWKNLLLHEIAHIDTCRFCNNKHHIEFWMRYEYLVKKFLKNEKPMERYNEDVGYFAKYYDI